MDANLSLREFLFFLLISAIVLPIFVMVLFSPSIWEWFKKRRRR